MSNNELLYKLLSTPSPSGYEVDMQKKVIEEMKPYVDKVYTSLNQNVVQGINVDSKMKVLLSGHIDEISLVIEKVLENGTCKLVKNGGINPLMYAGHQVSVVTKKDGKIIMVPGVIGYYPNMDKGQSKVDSLTLDLGTSTKEEALSLVSVGDPVIHTSTYVNLAGNRLSGRALDNRLGAFICLEVLKRCKEKKTTNGVFVSTTVGEETTGRGAIACAHVIKPTCALIVDVTYTSDVPHIESVTSEVALGKGPVLTIGSLLNDKMHEMMKEISKSLNYSVQYDLNPSRTYTDTDNIFSQYGEIPCYLVSIPLRYMHSSVEVCDLKDVEEIITLLTEFILSLNDETSFDPFK